MTITASTLRLFDAAAVQSIEFYKLDEITSDLICCDVSIGDGVWTFHEKMDGWEMLIAHLEGLPGFRCDWFAKVSQPAFLERCSVALAGA